MPLWRPVFPGSFREDRAIWSLSGSGKQETRGIRRIYPLTDKVKPVWQ